MDKRYHYERFKYVFLYITERCQLKCRHCYMGGRLDEKKEMDQDRDRRCCCSDRSPTGLFWRKDQDDLRIPEQLQG